MAEAISVLSLVDGITGVLRNIDELARDFRHAPTDIASLAHSLQSLMGILDSVVHDNTSAIADSGRKHSPSFQDFFAIDA